MRGKVLIPAKDLRTYLEIVDGFEKRGKQVEGIEITFGETLSDGTPANSVAPIFKEPEAVKPDEHKDECRKTDASGYCVCRKPRGHTGPCECSHCGRYFQGEWSRENEKRGY